MHPDSDATMLARIYHGDHEIHDHMFPSRARPLVRPLITLLNDPNLTAMAQDHPTLQYKWRESLISDLAVQIAHTDNLGTPERKAEATVFARIETGSEREAEPFEAPFVSRYVTALQARHQGVDILTASSLAERFRSHGHRSAPDDKTGLYTTSLELQTGVETVTLYMLAQTDGKSYTRVRPTIGIMRK